MTPWESIPKAIHLQVEDRVKVEQIKEALMVLTLEISEGSIMGLEAMASKIKAKEELFMSNSKDRDKEQKKWGDRDKNSMSKLKEKQTRIIRISAKDSINTTEIRMVENTTSSEDLQRNSLTNSSKTNRITINKQEPIKIGTMVMISSPKIKSKINTSKNLGRKLHSKNGKSNSKEISNLTR